ncbi:MAG TPA: alpha-amylase family glycosyl hydrolase [Deltaproteobacteria bacterium]|nr:alpha-amylase family glycosyl hydrolase [Deltaproteobacteria bacterium]
MYEFHISRNARDLYNFDQSLFTTTGNVILANPQAARDFADRMNRIRDAASHPDKAARASDINAMGLIDEIMHFMIELYRRQVNPNVIKDAYDYASTKLPDVDRTLEQFLHQFPPRDVYQGKMTVQEYMASQTGGVPNRLIAMEEMLLLYISNENRALANYQELFDDTALRKETPYLNIISFLEEFFRTLAPFGPFGQTLLDLLLAPLRAAPHSLYEQLEYIRKHWGYLLAELYIRLLSSLDLIREETKVRFLGKGYAPVISFGLRDYEDIERFSPDEDWMPSLVLMAKSVYVWLHQLSVKYGRDISRLDRIPDEELEILARWGFTGLWLIGIWERSPASKTIKRMTGNPEAESSAYSLYDYTIASELGGDTAFDDLKARALRYGIRMATDMVPNHTGIYSRWVIEHPDWYIQLEYPPFPAYRYTGANLSHDERVEIQIEDGYWSRTDAAVVFRRHDRWTGQTRFIYHGNDGTSMPWNDTAQLDFLKHEVRQAVIGQTIAIAKRFPIIRFDAAMTLAKRHFQRLWYPAPGYGGDIPSRAGHSVSPDEFERLFPVEFWRELVDRIAVEAPNTLLLAEAFWLMEGYFVRSLGMHRVYNSAFMNMLKAEDNSKYRDVMKNVLRFNPEILRRFVNFMNNPDEEPAVHGFGKDDKYFGVATLMATMPGLPMFGHGQIEGFSEKYGMEYRRSYWDEPVDGHLVWRHEREIFPLLKKRRLFSGVEHFVLYDFRTPEGHVNEDVFAYSNRFGDERTLVVYNNRFSEATGTISRSVGMNVDQGGRRHIVHRSLGEGLDLKNEDIVYYILHDERGGLEYLRSSRVLWRDGLMVHLGAFKCHVFTSFREIHDYDGRCAELEQRLMGMGVPDMMTALRELSVEKVFRPFSEMVSMDALRMLVTEGVRVGTVPAVFSERMTAFLKNAREFAGWSAREKVVGDETCLLLDALFTVDRLRRKPSWKKDGKIREMLSLMPEKLPADLWAWRIPMLWALVAPLGRLGGDENAAARSASLMDDWMLGHAMHRTIENLGADDARASYEVILVTILARYQGVSSLHDMGALLKDMLTDTTVRDFLGFNLFDDRWWFNKESMDVLISWLALCAALRRIAGKKSDEAVKKALHEASDAAGGLMRMVEASGFEVPALASLLDTAG